MAKDNIRVRRGAFDRDISHLEVNRQHPGLPSDDNSVTQLLEYIWALEDIINRGPSGKNK